MSTPDGSFAFEISDFQEDVERLENEYGLALWSKKDWGLYAQGANTTLMILTFVAAGVSAGFLSAAGKELWDLLSGTVKKYKSGASRKYRNPKVVPILVVEDGDTTIFIEYWGDGKEIMKALEARRENDARLIFIHFMEGRSKTPVIEFLKEDDEKHRFLTGMRKGMFKVRDDIRAFCDQKR